MERKKGIIYVDMNGRLGNQLFQYAFARKINIDNNFDFIFDFKNVINKGKELKYQDSFVDALRFFNVKPYKSVVETGFELKKHGSRRQKYLLKKYYLLRRLFLHFKLKKHLQIYQYKMQRNGVYKEDECKIAFFKDYKNDVFVKGYFEDPSYFNDIRENLLEELTPKYPRLQKNKDLYDIIENNESVCVSFRVWNEIEGNKELLKTREVCSTKYYLSAINKMKEICPHAVFVIFSNDVNWVKKNFIFDGKVYYEDGTDEIYEKLRLMASCKHFIMSTSTFCWWAQYLSNNPNKVVISPDRWFNDGTSSKLLLDEWIKIKTE